jgi:hypothetical protein
MTNAAAALAVASTYTIDVGPILGAISNLGPVLVAVRKGEIER